ncbi:MAG: carboxypeptidase-like regulatory domain-containing protein [Bryobacteraceae bacterium]|jgi:hypothetical protein
MRSIKDLLRFAFLAGLCGVVAAAGDSTVIAGSVFRDPGYALPEATVTLIRRDDPKHKKLAQESTTYRGEFIFHVPANAAVYVVKASAKGYRAEEKEASVTGPDRIDLTFTLEPETRK